jgi:hypothetical protein
MARARRDAFTDLRNPHPMKSVEGHQEQNSQMCIQQPLDLIPTANHKKKRSRNWEKVHKQETATYRGIPRKVVEQVVDIAQSLMVPRDEVVRAFLENGVRLYRSGDLNLFAYPKAQRMTLFPEADQGNTISSLSKNKNQGWLSEAFPVPEKKSSTVRRKKTKEELDIIPQWDIRVTFRIPIELKEEVRTIAKDHTVPVGELVWLFVTEGLKAYQIGTLLLQPSPKTIGKTLFERGSE